MTDNISQSPWAVFYIRKLIALFSKDPGLSISINFDNYTVQFSSDNKDKLLSLSKVLKHYTQIDNTEIRIDFEGIDGIMPPTIEDWETAFKGNEYFEGIVKSNEEDDTTYAVFKKKTIAITTDYADYYVTDLCVIAEIVKSVTNPISGLSIRAQND